MKKILPFILALFLFDVCSTRAGNAVYQSLTNAKLLNDANGNGNSLTNLNIVTANRFQGDGSGLTNVAGTAAGKFSAYFYTNSVGQIDLTLTVSNLLYLMSVAPSTNIIKSPQTLTPDSLSGGPKLFIAGPDGTNHLVGGLIDAFTNQLAFASRAGGGAFYYITDAGPLITNETTTIYKGTNIDQHGEIAINGSSGGEFYEGINPYVDNTDDAISWEGVVPGDPNPYHTVHSVQVGYDGDAMFNHLRYHWPEAYTNYTMSLSNTDHVLCIPTNGPMFVIIPCATNPLINYGFTGRGIHQMGSGIIYPDNSLEIKVWNAGIPTNGSASVAVTIFTTNHNVFWSTGPSSWSSSTNPTVPVGSIATVISPDGTNLYLSLNSQQGSTLTASNIAQLQTYPASAGIVQVLGYYAAGDGGGGTFIPGPTDSTTPTNIGTVFVSADGKRFYRNITTPYVIPEWFGAVSETDCSAPIQYAVSNFANVVCLPTSTYGISYPGIMFPSFNGSTTPAGPGYRFDGANAMFVGIADGQGRYPTNMFNLLSSAAQEDWFRDVGYCTFSGLVSNSFIYVSGGYTWRLNIHDCQTTADTANAFSVVQGIMDSPLSQGGDWTVSRIYGGDSIRACFHLSATPGAKGFLDDCTLDHLYCFNQSYAGSNYPGAAAVYIDQTLKLQDARIESIYGASGAYCVWGDQRSHSLFWRCHFEQIYNEPQTTNAAAIFATTDECTFQNVNMYQPSQVTAASFVAIWGTNTHGIFSQCFATYNNGRPAITPYIVETNGSDYNWYNDCGTNGGNIVGPNFTPVGPAFATGHYDKIEGISLPSAPSYSFTGSPYTNTTISAGLTTGAAHFVPASSNGVTVEFDAPTNKGALALRVKDTNGVWKDSIGATGGIDAGATNDAGPGNIAATNVVSANSGRFTNSVTAGSFSGNGYSLTNLPFLVTNYTGPVAGVAVLTNTVGEPYLVVTNVGSTGSTNIFGNQTNITGYCCGLPAQTNYAGNIVTLHFFNTNSCPYGSTVTLCTVSTNLLPAGTTNALISVEELARPTCYTNAANAWGIGDYAQFYTVSGQAVNRSSGNIFTTSMVTAASGTVTAGYSAPNCTIGWTCSGCTNFIAPTTEFTVTMRVP